MSAFYEQRQFN